MAEKVWLPEKRSDALKRIYDNVACGVSLTRTLKELDDMPSGAEFWRWHMEDENIRDNLARARETGVEVHLEEAIDIAEDGTNDWMEKQDKDGNCIGYVLNGEHVQRSKLRIETRIKRAQMIAPRKYGPKVDVTTGGDKLPSTDAGDVATRVAGLLAQAQGRKDESNG